MSIIFENDFYIVKAKSSKHDDVWLARAETIRKDSGEILPSFSFGAAASNQTDVMIRLSEKLNAREKDLLLRPADWGSACSHQSIIRSYIAKKEQLKDFCFDVESEFLSGGMSAKSLGGRMQDFEGMVKKLAVDLMKKIYTLNESEKESLLFSSEEVYENIHDRGSFEDLYARRDIFDYIINPSDRMKDIHIAHESRCIAIFNKKE